MLGESVGLGMAACGGIPLTVEAVKTIQRKRRENWEQIGTKNLLLQGTGGLLEWECSLPQSGLSVL